MTAMLEMKESEAISCQVLTAGMWNKQYNMSWGWLERKRLVRAEKASSLFLMATGICCQEFSCGEPNHIMDTIGPTKDPGLESPLLRL